MEQLTFLIKDKNGMHARPAGAFVNEAKKYKSDITVYKGDKEANGKRLLSLMGLGAVCNSVLTVKAEGDDEKEAINAIKIILENNLSEG